MLAHAPPYKVLICDVFVAAIAVKVGPEMMSSKHSGDRLTSNIKIIILPFDLLGRLSPEVSNGEAGSLCLSRVYRDLGVILLLVFHFYCHQQQLEFYKTDPEMNFGI